MSTESYAVEIGGIAVEVTRKDIKGLRLRVSPIGGRVRVSVPRRLDEASVRRFVSSRLDWIREKRQSFAGRDREPAPKLTTGEMHLVQGRRCRLEVTERPGAAAVDLSPDDRLVLHVRTGTSRDKRMAALDRFYRELLRASVPDLIAAWEPKIGVVVTEWRIKKMTTRWGTCNPRAQRIWLNLELAKRPAALLESIVVHEMVHLLERLHNARFRGLMDRFLPDWREYQAELKRIVLAR